MLENTIVAGNSGSSDLAGFGASDGETSRATFSDLCAIGSATAPFAGAGNICAAPALANAPGGDAHETAASPTIDAGSNALIGSQPTDAFGDARILAGRAGDAPTVDIGAAESPAAALVPILVAKPSPAAPAARGDGEGLSPEELPRRRHGDDHLHRSAGPDVLGRAWCVKTVETLRGKRLVAVSSAALRRHKLTVTVGSASFSGLKAGSSRTLRLTLNAKGRALLSASTRCR